MSTTMIALGQENMAASVRSLKAELLKAKFSGVTAKAAKDGVRIQMPIAQLARYQFTCADAHCSWSTAKKKIVIDLTGFSIEQKTEKDLFLVTLRHTKPVKTNLLRQAFFRRSLRALEELQGIDEKKLAEAVQEPTDYRVLLSALSSEEALAAMRSSDPLAGARLRGVEAKRKMIEADGGALTSAEAANLLKISRQAVDKRRRENKLLGLELGKKGYHYPAWQFGLGGLEEVLGALGPRNDWEKLSFMLNPHGALDDQTPLAILQKGNDRVADVLAAAASFGEHGG